MSEIYIACISTKCQKKITLCVSCGQELSRFLMMIGSGACSEECLIKSKELWSGKPYEFKPRKTPCSQKCWDDAFAIDLELKAVKAIAAATGVCFFTNEGGCSNNLSVWRTKTLSTRQEELIPANYLLVCKPHGFKHL